MVRSCNLWWCSYLLVLRRECLSVSLIHDLRHAHDFSLVVEYWHTEDVTSAESRLLVHLLVEPRVLQNRWSQTSENSLLHEQE